VVRLQRRQRPGRQRARGARLHQHLPGPDGHAGCLGAAAPAGPLPSGAPLGS
jgi:hypothetical protein